MKKIVVVFFYVLAVVTVRAQEKTLVVLDGEKISANEFKKVYEKNLDVLDNEESRDINYNLDLFINYKLKLKEAYRLKIDTLTSYKNEFKRYHRDLKMPYLKDTTVINNLIKEAYFRTVNEVKVKHILIKVDRSATAKDTLKAYNKILKIRQQVLNTGNFEAIASKFSDDLSARTDVKSGRKGNNGNLGYISAFLTVYPFENAAYTTKVGKVSMPFRTNFGYHIVKVEDIRPAKGKVEAAHILIKDTTYVGKSKIEAVYQKLIKNQNFEDLVKLFSEDISSREDGGKIGIFSNGSVIKEMNDAIFGLEKVNDYSKPFKTKFGWHIVKLLKIFPVKSFEQSKMNLTLKVKNGDRLRVNKNSLANKLKKTYSIVENEKFTSALLRQNLKNISADSLKFTLITINNRKISTSDFVDFAKSRSYLSNFELYDRFKDKEIVKYYEDNLGTTFPEYASTIKEYKEGLLLFELMQQKIWNKAQDTLAIRNFFKNNKKLYKEARFETVKGTVANDYQNYIEKQWIADLRKKSKIKVRKSVVKELIANYK